MAFEMEYGKVFEMVYVRECERGCEKACEMDSVKAQWEHPTELSMAFEMACAMGCETACEMGYSKAPYSSSRELWKEYERDLSKVSKREDVMELWTGYAKDSARKDQLLRKESQKVREKETLSEQKLAN